MPEITVMLAVTLQIQKRKYRFQKVARIDYLSTLQEVWKNEKNLLFSTLREMNSTAQGLAYLQQVNKAGRSYFEVKRNNLHTIQL